MNGSFVWCVGVTLAFVAGCIIDRDAPCGDRQVELEGNFKGCTCAPGYAWSSDGKRCVRCGDNEVGRNGECVCEEGFARARSGAPCTQVQDASIADAAEPIDSGATSGPTGEGEACTSSADCQDYYASFCQTLAPPNVCLIQGCATGERSCTDPNICCVFAGFAPLESTNGLCVPAANCIGPGKPVTP